MTPPGAAQLMEEARRQTGLEDFGDQWFLAPLSRLLTAMAEEARLKAGNSQPHQRIRQALVDRLRCVALLKERPDILREPIRVAGAIVGLPRTGSTLLQRLLAASPKLTSTYWWEAAFPLPLEGEPPGDSSRRKAQAQAAVEAFYREWPDFDSIHPMDALAHDEEVLLIDKSFLSSTYDSIMQIPSYGFWMAQQDHTKAYEELKIWLQILQSQSPQRRQRLWILKTPHHLLGGGLGGLLRVFPDAKIVMTHRRIEELLPSYCSMCTSISSGSAAAYDQTAEGPYWMRRFADALHSLIDMRRGPEGDRFIDIRYDELTADPLATGRRALAALGLEYDDCDHGAMSTWLSSNRRESRRPHRYEPRSFGLSKEEMAGEFAFYRAEFGL